MELMIEWSLRYRGPPLLPRIKEEPASPPHHRIKAETASPPLRRVKAELASPSPTAASKLDVA